MRIDTDKAYMESSHVLLWDGDPNAGGTLISEKEAFTGNPTGNYVWFDWLAPRPLGQHKLYAQVLANDENTNRVVVISDSLKVEVIPQPKGPKR